jgi:tRNA G26 N,N-dimethylase Trm1
MLKGTYIQNMLAQLLAFRYKHGMARKTDPRYLDSPEEVKVFFWSCAECGFEGEASSDKQSVKEECEECGEEDGEILSDYEGG